MRCAVKKIISIIIVTLMLSLSAVRAEQVGRLLPLLVDDADILTDSEENVILNLLESVSEDIECEVAVVTVDSLDGKSAQAYADDFYDFYGYGTGSGDDGILFLLAMDEREWAFTTYGIAIRAIPNYALDEIADRIVPDLSSGDYCDAFTEYAELARDYVVHYRATGSVLGFAGYDDDFDDDFYRDDDSGLSVGKKFVISIIVSAVIALIVMLTIKSGMKTIRPNNFAKAYITENSLNLRVSRDTFLYRNVTRIRRESDSSRHSGSRGGRIGGGGGTHVSSSSRSHGGRSGRF